MRPTVLTALALWLAAAPLAQAGAWLREDGAALLSFSHEITQPREGGDTFGYSTLYGEYGLTGRVTVGFDIGKGDASSDWTALLFLRTGRELGRLPGRVALELGVGAAGIREIGTEAVLQPALSWGHSFETGLGWAWVNLDAKGLFHLAPSSEADPGTIAGLPLAMREGVKLDLALGLNLDDRTRLTLETRFERPVDGDDTLRLVPGIARRLGARSWITLSGIVGLRDDETIGLILGSRIEF
ncbi:hypothetical protein SAMN05444722_2312 [Rhodovulum sp. ES.010]|uniref:hypothetical protein n=1 Tax=Rhodovulum sp. ES.010 TaxID=1882821 RepID=UPI00092A293F|nr:hypothetical protein [Rhodovulum sp. ES.010]SIO46175.1 hypothetical protein SAMN05444722_2312 [Rhodovulum sp. ES.010]